MQTFERDLRIAPVPLLFIAPHGGDKAAISHELGGIGETIEVQRGLNA
jgi:hypothetical protein